MTREFHSSMATLHPIIADDFSTMDDDALAAAVSTLAAHIHAATYRLLVLIGLHGTAQHVEKFVRLYRRAKRAEETERADAQHENRGLTFWHEDDGTVVLHGRFPPEMGARILSALDAAMAAHAEEQPAAGWDDEGSAPEDVPRGTSGPGSAAVGAASVTDVRDRADAGRRRDAEVFLTDVPRGTFIRGPSRTVRRADALAWMAERVFESGDAPALSPDRHEIVVHVEAEVLSNGDAGRCEIEHRTAIAAETARRLCCDAGIACTAIMSSTGPKAARPRSTTSSCSVRPTTASCTRAGSACSASTTVRSGSPTPTEWPSDLHADGRLHRPTPSSSATNPSDSPSTARPRPRTGTASASTTTMR